MVCEFSSIFSNHQLLRMYSSGDVGKRGNLKKCRAKFAYHPGIYKILQVKYCQCDNALIGSSSVKCSKVGCWNRLGKLLQNSITVSIDIWSFAIRFLFFLTFSSFFQLFSESTLIFMATSDYWRPFYDQSYFFSNVRSIFFNRWVVTLRWPLGIYLLNWRG